MRLAPFASIVRHGREKLPQAVVAACLIGLLGGCGAGGEDARAGRVAARLYAAVAAKDGPRACAQLSESAVSELEKDEMAPCPKAVLRLELSGSAVAHASVFVTSARVELRGGDHVYLERTPQGWKVSAAGCKAQSGEEQPDDCEVKS